MSSVDLKYFYVRRRDEIYGPATANQLIRAAREGAVRPSDEIAVNAEGPWRSASTCIELGFRQPAPPPDDPTAEDDTDSVENAVHDDDEENIFVWDGYHRRGPISMAQLRLLLDWDQIALDSKVSDPDGRLTTAGVILKLVEEPVPAIEEPAPEPPVEKTPAPPPRRKKKQRQPSFPDLDVLVRMERESAALSESDEEKQESSSPRTGVGPNRHLVKSRAFHLAYTCLSVFISIEAAVYLIGACSLSGIYLTRLFILSMEVFVPFESAPEHLVGNDLMLAGVGLICIFCEMLLPLFFLYKADLDVRLWLMASLVGLVLSQVLSIESLASCGIFLCWVFAICGIATAGIGVWIISLNPNGRLLGFGLTAVSVTAISAILLVFAGMSEILEVQIEKLPPTLRGSGMGSTIIALSLLGQWLSLPLVCVWIVYSHTDDSTQEYMRIYLISGLVLSAVGLLSLGFLIAEPEIRFASIPLSLLPFVAGGILCSVLQSMMWSVHPAYSAR